jgi:GxxExxY protein
LIIELENSGLKCEPDKQINVNYLNIEIGNFNMDILVDEKVNVMLSISGKITREHETKLTNQLKLSEIEVG